MKIWSPSVKSFLAAAFVTACCSTAALADDKDKGKDKSDGDRVPFAKLLCLSSIGPCMATVNGVPTPALSPSFTVPAATASGQPVKELVIQFVSGDCVGTARNTEVFLQGSLGAPQVADTGDNFSINKIPMAVAQFNDTLNVNAAQAFAQATRLRYAPGTAISISFDFVKAGQMACKVQLNGHFVTR